MISTTIVLLILEYATIIFCITGMVLGLIASHLSFKSDKKNNFSYALVFMCFVYMFINHQYNSGIKIEDQVSILYRMFHLGVAVIFTYLPISKIIECREVLKWKKSHIERRHNT